MPADGLLGAFATLSFKRTQRRRSAFNRFKQAFAMPLSSAGTLPTAFVLLGSPQALIGDGLAEGPGVTRRVTSSLARSHPPHGCERGRFQ
jgi:hypothetical protein